MTDTVKSAEKSEKTVQKPAEKVVEKVKPLMIHTNFGRMVDPHTGLSYDRQPTELLKRTGWIDAQLEAGKMTLV